MLPMSQTRPPVQPSVRTAPPPVPATAVPPMPPLHAYPPQPANRSLLPLVLGVVGIVAVAAVGAEVVLLMHLRRPAEAAPQPQPPQVTQPTTQPTAQRTEAPRNDPAPRSRPAESSGDRSDPQEGRQPPRDPAPAETLNAQGPLVTAVGGLTAAHLYQTYLNLGLLADAVENEVYTPDQGKKLLDEINGLMDTAERQLSQVPPAALKPEERKALERVRAVHAQLRAQSKELRAYWDSEDETHAKQFQKSREEAWAGIKDLLRITD
jgi:hypothetical protein